MNTILSIRGGGIRGIIPACALVALEQQLGGLTRDHIAFCAGTSTGALITAAVAAGVPAADILKVYTQQTPQIFQPSGLAADVKLLIDGYQYDPKNMQKVVVGALGPAANWMMNDSPLPILISATAVNGHVWYFVRDCAWNAKTTGKVRLVDAAVASSCAPTYFNHWQVPGILGKPVVTCYDGGVGCVSNPAYEAGVEAFEYYSLSPGSSQIVDLGTGWFPGSTAVPSGLLETVEWTVNTLVDTSETWADQAARRQWGARVLQVLNPELSGNVDEADLSAIPALYALGQQFASTLDWAKILAV